MQIAKWLRERKLTYAVPREFPEPWPYFTLVVYVIAATVFVLLAFLNAALVGYETVTVLHPNFNITQPFWFDRFRPRGLGLSKPGTLCDPLTINPGERFTTNYSLFEWDLVTVGPKANKSLIYKGSSLQSCDVCAQYMDVRVQELDPSADLTTLICCDDVDGFSILAKTSLSLTTTVFDGLIPMKYRLNDDKYRPPVLGAIPEHVRYMMEESPRSMWLNTMLGHAISDFARDLFLTSHNSSGTDTDFIMSMFVFLHPCPPSNRTCENTPLIEDQSLRVTYSSTQYIYHDFFQALKFAQSQATISSNPYFSIPNLLWTILASVQIDLGNPSPSNFLLNRSMVDAMIFNNSELYVAISNQSAPPLTLEGPATIQALYPCRLQLAKPLGSAVVSVMVATLSMFMSGWAVFIFLSSEYAERKRELELGGQVGPLGYHFQASTTVIGESERVIITDDASSDGGGVEDLEHQ